MARTIRIRLFTFGELKGTARDVAKQSVLDAGLSPAEVFDAEFTKAGVLVPLDLLQAEPAVDGSTQEPTGLETEDPNEDPALTTGGEGAVTDTPETLDNSPAATGEPDPNEPVTDYSGGRSKKRATASTDTEF